MDFFGKFLARFWAPWPPQGPQNGPRDPGDRFKIEKKIDLFQKFGPEVSTIFEILIFGFLGVFVNAKLVFFDFPFFFVHPWGGYPRPPPGIPWLGARGGAGGRRWAGGRKMLRARAPASATFFA